MAKTYYKKIITAGHLQKVIVYPLVLRTDDMATRREKRRLSSEAQRRMNAIYSYQQLELQLAANYVPGDLWITLTYDDAHLPKSEAEADRNMALFLRRWRAARKKKKQELRCHWNGEHLHEHEDYFEHKRWHHHLCVNATGEDFELIRRCWSFGNNIEIRKLRIGGNDNYEAIARYMCKERSEKKTGKHVWHHTRNIQKPEVESFRVEPDEPVQAPTGSAFLDGYSGQNRSGHYRYIKYLMPFDDTPHLRARRRRRKR